MANKSLFASTAGELLPRTDAKNRHQAPAYAYHPRHALAQLAVTGTLQDTFYADAREQLDEVLCLAAAVEPEFLAKAAIYARQRGRMKDMPALMTAILSLRGPEFFPRAFGQVIDNGKMLRTFVQIMRSGAAGRKSLGSRPKALVQSWLNNASDRQILQAAVGQDPSLADVIKMVHPKPQNARREALFAWIIGKPCDLSLLPQEVQDFVRFKETRAGALPAVPFQMLTALPLGQKQWAKIAQRGGWQMLRMNLNTFARHGVFEMNNVTKQLAARLKDPQEIARSGVLPYQLLVAYAMAGAQVPEAVREALQDAMEIATGNVPAIEGRVIVCPDVSGSMHAPATGYRKGATSTVRYIDVAALVAAALQRKNRGARVLPFERDVVDLRLNPRDTVLTNAAKLAAVGGGATNCAAPLELLNAQKAKADLVVFVSDNQSWVGPHSYSSTRMLQEWALLKKRNPKAKLVCLDIAPYGTTQAQECKDILNVGGFSDAVFDVIAAFAKGELSADHWIGEIEGVKI